MADDILAAPLVADDELVERVARAICQADEQNGAAPWDWYGSDKMRFGYFDQARAVLAMPEIAALKAERDEALVVLQALVTAVTFADPPKLFNGALCHEARVPVGFVNRARAIIGPAQ